MAISLTIRRSDGTGTPTTVSIAGDGEIDTRAEARAALAAVPTGQDASSMTYVVGSASYSYAQITGTVCLGHMPHRRTYWHQDNWVLRHPGQCMAAATTDTAPVQERTAGEALTLADDAAVRTMGGLGATAQILGVQFDSLAEDTTAPFEIPASAMTAGEHQLKIRYRNPGDTTDRIKIVPIRLGAVERVAPGADGAAYGAVLNMPATATRTATATDPVSVGSVQTTAAFPANSTYQLFVDGNPVGAAQPLPSDRRTALTVPATVADGAHQIELRVLRTGQPAIIYPAVNVTVGPAAPASATLSTASVTSTSSYYLNDSVRIRVTSDRATRARITVGNHTQDVDLVAGVNNITLTGAPKTWDTGGAAGTRQVFSVQIQPSGGSAVTAGQVSIQRQGGGGGRGRGTGGVTL